MKKISCRKVWIKTKKENKEYIKSHNEIIFEIEKKIAIYKMNLKFFVFILIILLIGLMKLIL